MSFQNDVIIHFLQQHEVETSSRKPPISARAKKVSKELPPTPVPLPSQMRGWSQDAANDAGPSRLVQETPRRAHHHRTIKDSPTKRQRSPEFPKRHNAALPGFQNAFVDSTPSRPSHSRATKGKERAIEGLEPLLEHRSLPSYSQFVEDAPRIDSPLSSPTRSSQQNTDEKMEDANLEDTPQTFMDVDGDVDMAENDEEIVEELDRIEPFNWKAEVNHPSPVTLIPSFTS